MEPVTLRTARLVLDAPVPDDRARVAEYCRDPLFEQVLTTPWPYRDEDAAYFLEQVVPSGWSLERDFIWALREEAGGPLLGVIGAHRRRALEPEARDLGFWIGAPHRGAGYMPEAAVAVADWLRETGTTRVLYWECVVGNTASLRTAQKAGFTLTDAQPSHVAMRDGTHPLHWQGRLDLVSGDAS